MSAPQLLRDCPQFLFFTGKGGVGKTSIASACAVHLADEGKRVLLVSTDPASNLAEVLATRIGHRLTTIPGVVWPERDRDRPRAGGGGLPGADPLAADRTAAGSGADRRARTAVGFLHLLRSRPSTSSPSTWRIPQVIDMLLTTSCSTRPPPATPSDCCSCRAPGPRSWQRGRAMPPAWARWRGWTSTAPRTPSRLRPWLTRRGPGSCGHPRPVLVASRGRPNRDRAHRDGHHAHQPGRQRTPPGQPDRHVRPALPLPYAREHAPRRGAHPA